MLNNCYPFELPPLPYPYNALEPYIDEQTLHYHHDKHFQTYITNLNKAVEQCTPAKHMTLKQLLCHNTRFPNKVRQKILQNGGGVFNHDIYFKRLGVGKNTPSQDLLKAIDHCFGSFDLMKAKIKENALSVFGSGWTYLIRNGNGSLTIYNTRNQEVILRSYDSIVLLIDVWEHAYYLQYKNKRGDYIDNIWKIVRFSQ